MMLLRRTFSSVIGIKGKRWVLAKHFDGFPQDSNFKLLEEDVPEPKDGEVLFEAKSLSIDPYMRFFMGQYPTGTTMIGEQYARVISSKHAEYDIGDEYLVQGGWSTHTLCDPHQENPPGVFPLMSYPPGLRDHSHPDSYFLGVLGMPGLTAYFGLLRICDPKPGETVLVNTAAGAVGSLVGQMGKIKGCTVIGFAGTDKKCAWLKQLGFDHAFNYKTRDLDSAIKEGAPNGIDCYFDNVGGDFTSLVIRKHMNVDGRIALCGAIDSYNATKPPAGPYPFLDCIPKRLKLQGFQGLHFFPERAAANLEMSEWIKEGRLKVHEHVTEGFENMPKAFYGVLRGENTGKAIVKI